MIVDHILKLEKSFYRAVQEGKKIFEIRRDDRHFQCGDIVCFQYHDPTTASTSIPAPEVVRTPGFKSPAHSVEELYFRIGFVLRGGQYGLEPGYVAFSLFPIDKEGTQGA